MTRPTEKLAKPPKAGGILIRGNSASPGLGTAVAFWIEDVVSSSYRRKLSPRQVPYERARFHKAVDDAIAELKVLEKKITGGQPAGVKDIFAVHRMMLADPDIQSRIENLIRTRRICSEWAVEETYENIARVFSQMKNRHLATRREDVKDAMRFMLDHLAGSASPAKTSNGRLRLPTRPFIAVSRELSPAQTAGFVSSRIVGMVTHMGGRSSHAAIIAREIGIPLVFGLSLKHLARIKSGDRLCIDGGAGTVRVNPPVSFLSRFKRRVAEIHVLHREHLRTASQPPRTLDGVDVSIQANVDTADEISGVKSYGACGVGLFRTEYLYLSDRLPGEEYLYREYRRVVRSMAPRPVVVRTMDLGGDKFLSPIEFPSDLNPMLGMRAIRLCLAQPKLLMPQLRAALRASVSGNLKLCLPMISTVEEIIEVRKHIHAAARELSRRRIPYRMPPLGIMVEVPAVAVRIDRYIDHADFFSIGTNDLIQYTLAVSRTQQQVAHLYRPLNPSILWLLWRVVRVCTEAGKDVSLCGEEANNPLMTPFLLGIGLRGLSMAPPAIPYIKKLVCGLDVPQCREFATDMLNFAATHDVEQYIQSRVRPVVRAVIPKYFRYVSIQGDA